MSQQPLKLITEYVQHSDVRVLKEAVKSKDGKTVGAQYFIEGIFMQGNLKNQNGRVYPTEILRREMERYKVEYIDRKRALGELGHPDSPTINHERASHRIVAMEQDGDNFMGKAKVLVELPMGKIVKTLLDEGVELGVSTRGLGSLRETERGSEVQDDFFFSTVDIVSDPSAPDAFVHGIMEGKEWVWDGGVLRECTIAGMAKQLDAVHKPTVSDEARQVAFNAAWGTFLNKMTGRVSSKIARR